MTGRDAGLHTIALALDLPTKDAASEMAAIDSMTLQKGVWLHDDRILWEADTKAANGTLLRLMTSFQKGPARQFPAPRTFGQFLGAWVDGVFEPELGTYQDGTAELVLHRDGPRARFLYEAGDDVVELYYSAEGFEPAVDPPWEHPLIIRGEMFRRLAKVVA